MNRQETRDEEPVMSSVTTRQERRGAGEQPLLLLSAEALADRLGFSTRTIWRLRSAGKLPPSLKIGGSIRWRSQEIDGWIDAGCPDAKDWQARKYAESCFGSR
jgi:predicted DNA-binding transcriptional regulator AlpA